MKTAVHIRFIILPALVIILLSLPASAQQRRVLNLPKYDYHLLHFGITMGINNTDFRISRMPLLDSTLAVVESRPGGGFNLGILSDLRMGNYFNLRFIPQLSFTSRDLYYTFTDTSSKNSHITKKTVESTFMDFPLDIKYKSVRVNNYRMYVLAGGKYSVDMASQSNVNRKKELVKLKSAEYGYEVGFGMDFYLEFFKFSTEVKVYQGLNDVIVHDNSFFSKPISSLETKTLLFSFTFE